MRALSFFCLMLAVAGCFYDYGRLREDKDAGGGAGGSVGGAGRSGTGGSLGGAGGTAAGSGGIGVGAGRGGMAGATTGAAGTGGGSGAGAAGGQGGASGMTGAAGTTGMAGRGGTGGTAGTTGTGGQGGASGTTGAAGAAGMAGRGGTGGTAGTTGMAGRGGTGGTAGTTGTGGGTGGNSCPLGGVLDCTSAGALRLAPDGQVTDFSAAEWNEPSSSFCDAHGLDGRPYSFAGAGSSSTAAVDTTMRNLRFNFTVAASGYSGGGLTFDSCVNASAFNGLQFSAVITAGSLDGCTWQVQLQTQDQIPTTMVSPSGGTCASSCYRYPTSAIAAAPSSSATTITATFASFNNPAGSTIAASTQIVGLQWQANGSAAGCSVELRIDDIKFVTR